MVERFRPKQPEKRGGYFKPSALKFVRSGCTLLDCSVAGAGNAAAEKTGGAYPLGRMVNVVGDKSVGKTLLAIEASANFASFYPKGKIWYREAEAAFDLPYAEALGLPVDRVDFGESTKSGQIRHWDTVEDIFEDLEKILDTEDKRKAKAEKEKKEFTPTVGLYIIDSLDALSSRTILEKGSEAVGGYNLDKQKALGQLFSQLIRRLEETQICLFIISQTREKIGVTFGEKYTRTGGKAMDFYASAIIWLSHISNLTQTRGGVKRVTAVKVKAKVKKNKISTPHRECEFVLRFGYGVDDINANISWLQEVNAPEYEAWQDEAGRAKYGDKFDKEWPKVKARAAVFDDWVEAMDDQGYYAFSERVREATIQRWALIEESFKPARSKYGHLNAKADS